MMTKSPFPTSRRGGFNRHRKIGIHQSKWWQIKPGLGLLNTILAVTGLVYLTATQWGALPFSTVTPQDVDVKTAQAAARTNAKPCTPDAIAPTHLMVLIDATDPFQAHEQQRIAALMREITTGRDRLTQGSLLTVAALRADTPRTPARFTLIATHCMPRNGSDANPLFENAAMMKQAFERTFLTPLQDAVSKAMTAAPSSTSPLIRSLHHMAALPGFTREQAQRREIIVISDMIEYSPLLNQYRGGDDWTQAKRHLLVDEMQNRLRDVEITVLLRSNDRIAPAQNRRHKSFWQGLFKHAGVGTTRWRLL